ncbi:MAG: SDR family NAD(P)-dependent oxidoreductase [Nitrospira sp.]|nr:SDR family NAD(P)-dependent oxidoreductase [Nitrospira sp.]
MKRLEGKVAVVTGGNAGIGEAIAKRFADEGASVVITGRRQQELDHVVNVIRLHKGTVLGVAGSVTDDTHVQDVIRRTLDSFGKIDVLVNNAGIGAFGKRLHETDDTTWANVFDVNVTGVFRMTRAVIPQMLNAGARLNYQCFFHCQSGWPLWFGSLHGIQGSAGCLHQGGGGRICPRWNSVQCREPRPYRYTHGGLPDGKSRHASDDSRAIRDPSSWETGRGGEYDSLSRVG